MASLMSTQDVAEYIGVPRDLIYRWRLRGEGPPAIRVGGRYLKYRRSDVDAWLDRQSDSTQRGDSSASMSVDEMMQRLPDPKRTHRSKP